jgi:hypothetical protein
MFLESWSPLHEKVKSERVVIDVEYSLHCVLESLPMTHGCPHPPYLSLTFECSPSLPLTKRSMGSEHFPHRTQPEFPTQPISFNTLTRNVNGLNHSCDERIDYVIHIGLWMEEVCEGMNQPWYRLGLILHIYDLTLVPN